MFRSGGISTSTYPRGAAFRSRFAFGGNRFSSHVDLYTCEISVARDDDAEAFRITLIYMEDKDFMAKATMP